MSKKTNFENTLAVAGALLVLIGVTAAASSALADENTIEDTSASHIIAYNEVDDVITESAHQAAEQATDQAISAIIRDNALDLDIRLLDRTSLTSADK